jgi:hypothetical protein
MGKLKKLKMITLRQLEIYKKFNGDNDQFARIGSAKDKLVFSDTDWSLIDSFLQDLELVKNGLASDRFTKNLNLRLKQNLESEAVLDKLKSIK